jgi:PAS domain S-box-containing protein
MITLPGYQIGEELYESANSVVYRGRRTEDNQPAIVKILKKEYPLPQDIARFRREYEIAKRLSLAGVVKPYGLEKYQRGLAIIMEDFEGESLAGLMRSTKFAVADFLTLAIRITDILGEIHQRNIMHKDVNPFNILLNPATGQVKITDFGISTVLSRENATARNPNVLEGTLAYISPEQTGRMNRAIDYRTDFYSLGVTFYELLTGQLPFQTTDAMEMVHAHIAKRPIPPHQLNPEIPKALSDIVMKLLAKTAEERYQSTYGLKMDLQMCLAQLQSDVRLDEFRPGQYDLSDKFRIPEKLYGREQEMATLLAAFERVSRGAAEMMLVSGYSGIGKSVLVQEIHKPLVQQRGYFISGKFDRLKRNIPYVSLIDAFQELIRQLLTESEERIADWKGKLLTAFGPNGQIIIDVIPEVELIVGPQPPVSELGPTESQNRFNLVFKKFIDVFTQKEHPLVIFLDDLQWTDAATVNLLQSLMTAPDTQYLFMIGAYRDNEVRPDHPLMLTLDEMQKAEVVVNHISLSPLGLRHVNQLIADTLACTLEEAKPLAELVLEKTGGNPFFVNQFLTLLYEERLLEFVPPGQNDATLDKKRSKGGWRWDTNRIQAIGMTDNVIELVAGKLQKLPEATQTVLKLAACIGNQFDLNTLSTVYQKPPKETAADLWPALQEGPVLPIGDVYKFIQEDVEEIQEPLLLETASYKFLHDRVQQAAYSLISAEDKKAVHLQVGRLMGDNTPKDQLEEKIFDLVNHLNLGTELITDQEERTELARLNLMAGKKAKASTAYKSAVEYLTAGIELLPQDCWQIHYDLAFSLHLETAECQYLNSNFDEAERLFEKILQQAKTSHEKTRVYNVKIVLYVNMTKFDEAIAIGIEGLKLLGLNLPVKPGKATILLEIVKTKWNLGRRKIEELIHLPEMTDPNKKAAMNLLLNIAAPAFFVNQDLFALVTLKMVNMSLRYGNANISSFGYMIYAVMLGTALGNFESGYEFGQLALNLNTRFNNTELTAKLNTSFSVLVYPWRKPIGITDRQTMMKAYQAGLNSGDLLYPVYAVQGYVISMLAKGDNLDNLYAETEKYLDFAQRIKEPGAAGYLACVKQMALNLEGLTRHPDSFSDDNFDEEKYLADMQENNLLLILHRYYVHKLQVLYLFENYAAALEIAPEAEKVSETSAGTLLVSAYYFYYSLTLAALYPTATAKEKWRYGRILKKNQKKMRKWADNCPENFRHQQLLVAAEMARIFGKDQEAMRVYEQAIQAAQAHEYPQDEALANELAAKFYLAKGMQKVATAYLMDARYGYLRWNATAKVEDLDQKYPQLLSRIGGRTITEIEETTIRTPTTGRGSGALDLATVMKASQAISGEIVLGRLLERLITIVIENAGAQRGLLILEKEGDLVIEAEATIGRQGNRGQDSSSITVLQSIPVVATSHLSGTIINYVVRTRENVVLNDATREGLFTADPYIIANQSKSILCAPLINQGKLTGILYLENNLVTGAFTPDRLEVLKLLSAQIAISIENAELYTNLEQSEKKYRTLFEDSKDVIFITTPEGKIIEINQAGLELFGYTRTEVSQLNAQDVYASPDDRLKFRQAIERQGSVRDLEVKHKKKDGTEIDSLITATLRRTEAGRILGYQGVIRDVTERKRVEKERALLLAIQRELDVARDIQISLLPSPHPEWPGLDVVSYSRPTHEVGGDFYAYYAFDQENFALAVGDVSGKGTPAALLMAVSLASFQAIIPQALDPGELLTHLDRAIAHYTRTTYQNCALCYVEISASVNGESQEKVLRAANAGCIPPLIRWADGTVEWVEVSGMPLGVGFGAELGYREATLTLNKGDSVILASDGLVEAMRATGEMFGFDRLEQAVVAGPTTNAEAMLAHLQAEVIDFIGQTELHDDLTIVVLQV